MPLDETLRQTAAQLRDALRQSSKRIVLAESCTGGNIAATLAGLPGISNFLCGSFVVYRKQSKADWLGIDQQLLLDPAVGPVSQRVTRLLAENALRITSEADLALAVTGHLGPVETSADDGVIFCVLIDRRSKALESAGRLVTPSPIDSLDTEARFARLQEATLWALENAVRWFRQ